MTKKRKRLVAKIALTQKIRDVLNEFSDSIRDYGIFVVKPWIYEPIEDWHVAEFCKRGYREGKQCTNLCQTEDWYCRLNFQDKERIEKYLERKGWKRTFHGWK